MCVVFSIKNLLRSRFIWIGLFHFCIPLHVIKKLASYLYQHVSLFHATLWTCLFSEAASGTVIPALHRPVHQLCVKTKVRLRFSLGFVVLLLSQNVSQVCSRYRTDDILADSRASSLPVHAEVMGWLQAWNTTAVCGDWTVCSAALDEYLHCNLAAVLLNTIHYLWLAHSWQPLWSSPDTFLQPWFPATLYGRLRYWLLFSTHYVCFWYLEAEEYRMQCRLILCKVAGCVRSSWNTSFLSQGNFRVSSCYLCEANLSYFLTCPNTASPHLSVDGLFLVRPGHWFLMGSKCWWSSSRIIVVRSLRKKGCVQYDSNIFLSTVYLGTGSTVLLRALRISG